MIIIGITGTLGAGKGTIVDYLIKEKGFVHYSVRAFIAEEITKRGQEVNRDTLTAMGNELRATHTPSYITDQLFERAKAEGKNAVIESVRTPGEIASLRQKGQFYLFAVDANQRIRYDRQLQRYCKLGEMQNKRGFFAVFYKFSFKSFGSSGKSSTFAGAIEK